MLKKIILVLVISSTLFSNSFNIIHNNRYTVYNLDENNNAVTVNEYFETI